MRNTAIIAFLGLASLVFQSGCTDPGTAGRPKLFPSSGTVTRGGKPVEGATVAFINEKMARNPTGQTDAQGKFQLGTYGNTDGAPAGDYIVTVTKVAAASTTTSAPPDPASLAKMAGAGQMTAPKVDASIPERYSDPKKKALKATVKGDGQDIFTFELVD